MVRLLNYTACKHVCLYACVFSTACANVVAGCCCNQNYDYSEEPSTFESSFYGLELVNDSRSKLAAGNVKLAILLMEKAIETFYPNNPHLYLELSKMYVQDNRKDDSVRLILQAIDICESSGIKEQVYADCLFFYSSLTYKSDIASATAAFKRWSQNDKFALRFIDYPDGSYTQVFPDNMLTPGLKTSLIDMLVSEGFCDSPSDIKFDADSMTVLPSWVKKNSKCNQVKAFDFCEATCDQAAVAMAMGCNCIIDRKRQFLCLSATQAFLRKCYHCCEAGLGNCIHDAVNALPRSPDHWLTNE